MKTQVFASVV